MTVLPKFEPLEDRIVLDAEATVGWDADNPNDVLLGQSNVGYTLTFDNTGNQTGYAPFIDLVLPNTGHDGDDGVTLNGTPTFLGQAVTTTSVTFDAAGNAAHPYATDAAGNPLVVTGTPGDTLVVMQLPFGSFTPGNPKLEVKLNLDFSNLGDLDKVYDLKLRGGYALGQDALDNPATDPPKLSDWETRNLTHNVFKISKTNTIPDESDHGATGPNNVYTHTIRVDVAPGQTLTDFVLTDRLPEQMVYLGNLQAAGGTVENQPVINAADPIPGLVDTAGDNNLLKIKFASLQGSKTVTFQYYIPETTRAGATVVPEATGAATGIANTAQGEGDWDPIDGRDPSRRIGGSATDNYSATSLAVYKSGAIAVDADGNGTLSPGDTYKFTVKVNMSDYFAYGQLKVEDVLGDGWVYQAAQAQFATTESNGQSITTTAIAATEETVTALGNTTKVVWDLSEAMRKAGQDTFLIGSNSANAAVPGAAQTTVTLTYFAKVDTAVPSGTADTVTGQGDPLQNDVKITGKIVDPDDLPDPNNPADPKFGNSYSDAGSHSVTLAIGQIKSKSIALVNGVAYDPTKAIVAGDLVTWKVHYSSPMGSVNGLRLVDNLPTNVFDVDRGAGGVAGAAWVFDNTTAGIPAKGHAQWATDDQLHNFAVGTPTITKSVANNGLTFDFGSLSLTNYAKTDVKILFTTEVVDAVFAEKLLLTNQATAFEKNSFGRDFSSTAIAQFTYAEPKLKLTKGVVAHRDVTGTPTYGTAPQGGPVTFNAPGTAGARWSGGVINSDGITATPINSDLSNLDAGDTVTFAIVIENTGIAANGAFDITLNDVKPAGFDVPAGGLNLRITDGTGTRTVGFTSAGNVASDLFTAGGITLVDDAQGAARAYNATSGANIIVITYDLTLQDSVRPGVDTLTNTAHVSRFASFDEGTDRLTTDLTDEAKVTLTKPTVTKTLISREVGDDSAQPIEDKGVRVGEDVSFKIRYDLTEGTYKNVKLIDRIEQGGFTDYNILSASITAIGSGVTGFALNATGTVPADEQSATFSAATMEVTGNNDGTDQFIEITVLARADVDAAGNADNGATAGAQLRNTGILRADGLTDITEAETLRLIEPNVSLTKAATPTVITSGSEVEYAVTVKNPARAGGNYDAPAYDLVLKDDLANVNVSLKPGSVKVTLDGTDITATALTVVGGKITVTLDKLDINQTLLVTYKGVLVNPIEANKPVNNTANLTFDSLPTDNDPDERDYTLNATKTVRAQSPDIAKAIVATGNADSSGSNVQIGETITYDITLTFPEGTSSNATLSDFLPKDAGNNARLQLVSATITSIGSDLTTARSVGDRIIIANPANAVVFNFGNVTNPQENGVLNAEDKVTIRVVALVTEDDDNGASAAKKTLLNRARLTTDNGAGVTTSKDATAKATILEPKLTLDKSVVTPSNGKVDAGDTVTYKLVSKNTGNGAAYDVQIKDPLSDSGLTVPPGTQATVVIKAANGTVKTTTQVAMTNALGLVAPVAKLLPGETVEVSFAVKVTAGHTFSTTIPNTAQVASFESDPNAANGRTYANGLSGYTVPTDNAQVATPDATLAKAVIRSSDGTYTTGKNLSIGETVTYRLTLTLPEGSADLVLSDTLPAGLLANAAIASAKVISYDAGVSSAKIAQGATNLTDTDISIVGGNQIRFDFGRVTVTGTDDAAARDAKIIVEVTAKVQDVAGNTDGTTLTNSAKLSVKDGATALQADATASDTVKIVEPKVTIDKSGPVARNKGDNVPYEIVISNKNGTGPAFDVLVEDLLSDPDLGLISTPTFVLTKADNTTQTLAIGTLNYSTVQGGANDGFRATIPVIGAGESLKISYTARLSAAALDAQSFPNTATAKFDTVQDGSPTTAGARPKSLSDTHSIGTVPFLEKAVTGTSLTETGSGQYTALEDVNVGEVVTYTLKITLPEIGMNSVIMTDTLPAGLTYVAGSAQMSALPGGITAQRSGAAAITVAGQVITVDMGAVTNASDGSIGADDVITLTVKAKVDANAANLVADGNVLKNDAVLNVKDSNDVALTTKTADARVEVVNPNVPLAKSGPNSIDVGQDAPYELLLQNTGKGVAYDVKVTDPLAASQLALKAGSVVIKIQRAGDAGYTVLTPGSAGISAVGAGTGGDGFAFTLDVFKPGDKLLVTYKATGQANIAALQSYDNTARVDYDSLPGGGQSSAGAQTGTASDTHSVKSGPNLSKTVASTSNADTTSAAHRAANPDVMVGERVFYDLKVTLPELAFDTVTLKDKLPDGLVYVGITSVNSGADIQRSTGAVLAVGDITVTTDASDAQTKIFALGALKNIDTDGINADDVVTLRIEAKVVKHTNITDGKELTNTASLLVSPKDAATTASGTALAMDDFKVVTDTAKLDVVEPKVTIDKSGPVASDQGNTVTYTIKLKNTGTGKAYDIALNDRLNTNLENDRLNTNLEFVAGSVLKDGVALASTVVAGPPAGFDAVVGHLDPGASATITYQVKVKTTAPDATTFPNTATIGYDTVSGANPASPDVQTYSASDKHFMATVPWLTKEIVATDVAQTGDDMHTDGRQDAAIGEVITYDLTLYLPEIVSTGKIGTVIFKDKLPDGLVMVPVGTGAAQGAQITKISGYDTQAAYTAATDAITGTNGGSVLAVGQYIAYDPTNGFVLTLTDVKNPFDASGTSIGTDDTITIRVKARVGTQLGGDTTKPADGDTLTNTATLDGRTGAEGAARWIWVRPRTPP